MEENAHAIITGGSSGIGKATARLLAERGANITLIARTPTTLASAKAEIESVLIYPQQRVNTISADMADCTQAQQAIADAIEQLGPPTYLITSAGIAHPGYCQQLPLEIFERTMAVNYFGTLYAIMAALPVMQAQRRGSIVLISSGAGLVGVFGYTAYSPSKFAVRGLAEALRGELRLSGIHISVAYPPDTDTPQLQEENKTKPLETRLIASTSPTWSAENVARTIIDGITKRKFTITPGLEMTLVARLHSLFLPQLNWYFDRLVAKARKQKPH
jgi:3-dehydrosphinganine reductase